MEAAFEHVLDGILVPALAPTTPATTAVTSDELVRRVQGFVACAEAVQRDIDAHSAKAKEAANKAGAAEALREEIQALQRELREKEALITRYNSQLQGWDKALGAQVNKNTALFAND
jgi:predicted RNase H-like nuclease (RuvC/YqgF family)